MGKEWDKFKEGKNIGGGTSDKKSPYQRNVMPPAYYIWTLQQKNEYQFWCQQWATELLRILKPGAFLLAFGGTRTYHRLTCGIEDAGFEIRDCIMWIYGSGFPKSRNIGKDIEKINVGGIKNLKQVGTKQGIKVETGTQGFSYSKEYVAGKSMGGKQISGEIPVYEINNQWSGWGTALKPSVEPIVVCRKPLSEKSVAGNVLKWGTGGINVDGCRVGTTDKYSYPNGAGGNSFSVGECPDGKRIKPVESNPLGRFPANLILECTCDEVIEGEEEIVSIHNAPKGTFAGGEPGRGSIKNYRERNVGKSVIHTNPNCPCYILDKQSGILKGEIGRANRTPTQKKGGMFGIIPRVTETSIKDIGGASRFFYCAKASKSERNMGCEDLTPNPNNVRYGIERLNTAANKQNNSHPCVKPLKLMEYLVKLITPPNGIVLDCFAGSGSTLIACKEKEFKFIGIEKDEEYCEISEARLNVTKYQGELF